METKKCPYCAEEIKYEAVKCRYCGEFLTNEISSVQRANTWVCMNCKEEVENTFDTCWNCGASIEGTIKKESDIEFNEVKKEAGKQYSSGTGHIVLSILIFTFIGFGFGYYMSGNISGKYIDIKDIFLNSGLEEMITSSIREKIIVSTIIGGVIGGVMGNFLKKNKKLY